MRISRTIRLCAEILRALRQRHQPAVSTAIQRPRQRLDIRRPDAGIPSLDMILWARVRPVVCAGRIWCRTLAERFRRTATGGVGRKVGQGVVEVGEAVVAGVIGTTLVRGAVDQIGRCVVADTRLAVCILVEKLTCEERTRLDQ